mgnify:CR=1 FL=1
MSERVTEHEFGGSWTEDKLKRVRNYLNAYTTIFTKGKFAQRYQTVYLDAFAGTGYRTRRSNKGRDGLALFTDAPEADEVELLEGSAANALSVEPRFARYVFIELDPRRARELERLREQFPAAAKSIEIRVGDANCNLQRFCSETDWARNRAVVFLDPYAMEVEWRTIECIASTKATDMWMLFPVSAVNRLLTRSGEPPARWAEALSTVFGDDGWRSVFYKTRHSDTLFGRENELAKEADFAAIGRYFVHRLQTVFPKVAVAPRPLLNSRNVPLFLLCFAAANAGPGGEIALRIARDILRA